MLRLGLCYVISRFLSFLIRSLHIYCLFRLSRFLRRNRSLLNILFRGLSTAVARGKNDLLPFDQVIFIFNYGAALQAIGAGGRLWRALRSGRRLGLQAVMILKDIKLVLK